jgi:hypothetical protein
MKLHLALDRSVRIGLVISRFFLHQQDLTCCVIRHHHHLRYRAFNLELISIQFDDYVP